uniref:Odorant-binding protein 21 n=1 Tax=Ectropis obliqua TaxID=248899 RepID=A0A1L2BLF1_ECTOB|nr:odorant-binding protein 21 [Ectropis obliqua]
MISQLTLVLLLVGACYGRTDLEVKGWFFSLAVICNKDYTIAPEELAMMQDHRISDSPNAKCLMACIFKKADMMDDKGNYDLEKTNKWVETEFSDSATRLESARNLFNMCKKVNDEPVTDGEKGCERAYLLSKCLVENSPKIGFATIE